MDGRTDGEGLVETISESLVGQTLSSVSPSSSKLPISPPKDLRDGQSRPGKGTGERDPEGGVGRPGLAGVQQKDT